MSYRNTPLNWVVPRMGGVMIVAAIGGYGRKIE